MKRQIYIVNAQIVGANGAFAQVSGYPKVFDSRSYGGDIDKAQRRASGALAEAWSEMCSVDTRQMQTVTMMTADGFIIENKTMGALADDPEPEESAS